MDTSDAMIDELLEFRARGPLHWRDPAELLAKLPLRSRVHRADANPFVSAVGRAAGIGVAAVVCFTVRNDDDIYALLGLRSSSVSTWRNTWHVFPSGMLGARFVDFHGYHAEDVRRAWLAEFQEELFDVKESAALTMPPDHVDDEYDSLVGEYEARIVFTGVAFDLLNLRPELCGLIYIGDQRWYERTKFAPNYEVARASSNSPLFYPTPVRWSDERALSRITPDATVPSGAAAFWAGVDVARRLAAESG
jgi:hypothetical protein